MEATQGYGYRMCANAALEALEGKQLKFVAPLGYVFQSYSHAALMRGSVKFRRPIAADKIRIVVGNLRGNDELQKNLRTLRVGVVQGA